MGSRNKTYPIDSPVVLVTSEVDEVNRDYMTDGYGHQQGGDEEAPPVAAVERGGGALLILLLLRRLLLHLWLLFPLVLNQPPTVGHGLSSLFVDHGESAAKKVF